ACDATEGPAIIRAQTLPPQVDNNVECDLNVKEDVTAVNGELYLGALPLPPLPQKMTPAQAARMAEIFDFLHRGLTIAAENVRANEDGSVVHLNYTDWQ